ncbi:tetratricopeptide repeat protein [Algivirga pacifica]|uniref:Tfp pilus assembly protein PilF n=1 Tax=Algivirga pacifica TaxID=1162670 RepID=A0ABP9DCH4_9BACT
MRNRLSHLLSIALLGLFIVSCSLQSERDQFFLKGKSKLEKRAFQEAARDFSEAIRLDSTFSEAYINRGVAYAELGNLEEALEDYQQALVLNDTSKDALFNRAIAYFEVGKYQKSLEDLNKAEQVGLRTVNLYVNRGMARQQLGDTEGALLDFEEAIVLQPENTSALVNKGYVHFSRQEYDLAEESFQKALVQDPKHADALNNIGMVAIEEKNYDKAIKYLTKALNINAAHPYYRSNRAYVLALSGEIEESRKDLKVSLFYQKDNSEALRNMGITYLQERNWEQAKVYLDSAATLNQFTPKLNYYQYLLYKGLKDKRKACTYLQKSVSMSENMLTDMDRNYCQ